jgi:3-hydroxy acid dehydrogenase / malonic semialdehyde reductase
VLGTPIRITHISPGLVSGTEFSNVRLSDDQKAALVYKDIQALRPEDVADNIIYAVSSWLVIYRIVIITVFMLGY